MAKILTKLAKNCHNGIVRMISDQNFAKLYFSFFAQKGKYANIALAFFRPKKIFPPNSTKIALWGHLGVPTTMPQSDLS